MTDCAQDPVTWAGGAYQPTRYEVPPAWRLDWAAARPPIFMSASGTFSIAIAARHAVIAAVAIAHQAAVLVPIIATRARLELRADHGAGGGDNDPACNCSPGPSCPRTTFYGAGRTTENRAPHRVVLCRRLPLGDKPEHNKRNRHRRESNHGQSL